tara:strand:- start:2636 stop:3058 length:423 start_codon:yes stop_codon:yes gene_type:complete
LAYRLAGANKKDLLQEVALIICEEEDSKLERISEYFNFWCVRVMINITGKRGSFTKLYNPPRLNKEDVNFDRNLEYNGDIDEMLDRVDKALEGVYWYKRELFKLYVECGSFRKVEKEVGINYLSVFHTVKDVKNRLKDKL